MNYFLQKYTFYTPSIYNFKIYGMFSFNIYSTDYLHHVITTIDSLGQCFSHTFKPAQTYRYAHTNACMCFNSNTGMHNNAQWWWWSMFYGHFCALDRLNGPSHLQRWNTLQICPRWDSNTGGGDLWSNTLPLSHGGAPQQRTPLRPNC